MMWGRSWVTERALCLVRKGTSSLRPLQAKELMIVLEDLAASTSLSRAWSNSGSVISFELEMQEEEEEDDEEEGELEVLQWDLLWERWAARERARVKRELPRRRGSEWRTKGESLERNEEKSWGKAERGSERRDWE